MPGEMKTPGPDHPITLEPTRARVTVTLGGRVIADSTEAITLREASYPPVQYIPLADVDQSLLRPTETSTYCPYKGDAAYYSIPAGGKRSVNAAWQYRAAYPWVGEISGYVAFYPNRVDGIDD